MMQDELRAIGGAQACLWGLDGALDKVQPFRSPLAGQGRRKLKVPLDDGAAVAVEAADVVNRLRVPLV